MGSSLLQTPTLPVPIETTVDRGVSRRAGLIVDCHGFLGHGRKCVYGSVFDIGGEFVPWVDVCVEREYHDGTGSSIIYFVCRG